MDFLILVLQIKIQVSHPGWSGCHVLLLQAYFSGGSTSLYFISVQFVYFQRPLHLVGVLGSNMERTMALVPVLS